MDMLAEKLKFLRDTLKSYQRVVIAFSGGIDSTLLLKVAAEELPNQVLAVTAVSDTFTPAELELAKNIAAELNVEHIVIESGEMKDPKFAANDAERCYYCKRIRFDAIAEIARARGINYVLDGSNKDDVGDYRPGRRATEELGVKSPLQLAGLSKKEVRELARQLGLQTWNLPAVACLASRIPYGDAITKEKLDVIRAGEEYLRSLGFTRCRLRHHGSIARIEVPKEQFDDLLANAELINEYLLSLGYHYITLDLAGLNSGSMNKVLKDKTTV